MEEPTLLERIIATSRDDISTWAASLVALGPSAAVVLARRGDRLEVVSESPPEASREVEPVALSGLAPSGPASLGGGWRAWPLVVGQEHVGWLAAQAGQHHEHVSTLVSAVFSHALWAHEATRRARRQGERTRHALALAQAVCSAAGLRELLLACSRGLLGALPFDEAYLLLEEGEAFRVFAIVPRMDGETPSELVWSEAPLTRRVLDSGVPLYVPDLGDPDAARRYAPRVYDPDPTAPQPMRSYMAAPIRTDAVSGVISVQASRSDAYTEADLQQLATLAELIGVALRRARWEERDAILQRIGRLGRYAQSADVSAPLLDIALASFSATLGVLCERATHGWRCATSGGGEEDLRAMWPLLDQLFEAGEPRSFNSFAEMPPALVSGLEARGCSTVLLVPLRSSSFSGVIMLCGGVGFTEWDRSRAKFMARELVPHLENIALYRKLEEEAIRDPLTGAFNRRYFMLKAAETIAAAKRYEQSVGLLIVDLQRFSSVNNTHGHQTGDRVLCRITECFQTSLRESDLFFRIGGDEFVGLLPHATRQSASIAARRCAAALSRDEELARYAVAANIGFSIYPDDGEDLGALLEVGDARMYAAKAAERAVYESYRPHEEPRS